MKVLYSTAEINYVIPKVMGLTLYSLTEIGVRMMYEREFLEALGCRKEVAPEDEPLSMVNTILDKIVHVSRVYGLINEVDYKARVDDKTHALAIQFYDRIWAQRPSRILTSAEDAALEYFYFICHLYFVMAQLYQNKEFDFEKNYAADFYEKKLSVLHVLDQRDLSVSFLCDMITAAWKVIKRQMVLCNGSV